jgi:predicted  nucleic acid-binding Zn-ribbon protein
LPDHDSSPDELPDHDIGDGDSHSEPPSADPAASVEPPADDDQPDVGTDDSDSHSEPPSADPAASVEPPADDAQPDLQELREELNEQFESVKVLAPGQYELNLMELYDRKEYIVALQEDGHYSIQVPEAIQE